MNGRDFSTRPSDSLEMTDESKGSAHCKGPLDHLLIVRYACFVPVMAINKPDFLAGYSLFYESARYGGDFLAAIENNRNLFWITKPADDFILQV
mgnify:CR=1 FL=1